ncbi:MAG TPA: SGNH/GDSL hydrolase family protein [Oligoflexus sp.]|uniref:SGNH/GDSL hydrolase family protein n=1 Tax=Oligoflexus sp. TaxID=1971216 RepID=UPI002D505A62|nr:SGNH/GDSL hydrolase family protein [Oligoflexus sp.]HYX36324.1 SGNH/GDSL hydrolase family protein [Oligoflexus sp.]
MRLLFTTGVAGALFFIDFRLYAGSAGVVVHDQVETSETRATTETLIIGDSIFALNGLIGSTLEKLSSQDIDSYAGIGAVMSGIVRQYQRSREYGFARTVIMNGGGNDVLTNMGPCRAFTQSCVAVIDSAINQAADLVEQMESDGVASIYYLGYYYTTGLASGLDQAIDYAMLRMPDICAGTQIRCEVIDTRDAMQGGSTISWDGIHPSRAGSIKMAGLLWERMQANGTD